MKLTRILRVLAVAMVAASVWTSGPSGPTAFAQDGEAEALVHFRRGLELYQEGALDASLVEFLQAYEMAPNYRVRFNIAQVHYEMRDFAAALREFSAYLEEGGDEVERGRRAEVEAEIVRLRARVGTLVVRSNVEGATVLLNGESLGTTPLEPQQVNLGRHRVSVELEGYGSRERQVRVASGATAEVELNLEPTGGTGIAAAAPSPAAPAAPGQPNLDGLLIGTGVVALLSLVAGAVGLGLTANADSDLSVALSEYPADTDRVQAIRNDVTGMALFTDIAFATALATGGTFIVTAIVSSTMGGAEDSDTSVSIGPFGASLRQRF